MSSFGFHSLRKKKHMDAVFLMGTEDFLYVGSLSSQRNVHIVQ